MNDEGAQPAELLLEACRRNNLGLLEQVYQSVLQDGSKSASKTRITSHGIVPLSVFLNQTVDIVGRGCLHLAAENGCYEILDSLLDQEGVEVDPRDRLDGETPLHKAVHHINSLDPREWTGAASLIELLLDAGADPLLRNKGRLKPSEIVDPRNNAVKIILQKAETAGLAMADVLVDPESHKSQNDQPSDSD